MKKLEKRDVTSDGKTYFMFTDADAVFIKKVKSEFGLSNTELSKYCLDLLRVVINYPEIINIINDLEQKKK